MIDYYEVVRKLIGPVRPVGDSSIDEQRFDNLEELTALVDRLLFDIDDIATANTGSHEHSRNKAGKHCADFLDGVRKGAY